MIDDYLRQLKVLSDKKKELDEGIDAIKAQISKEMEENGMLTYKCSIGSITTVPERCEKTINLDEFRNDSPDEYALLLENYPKEVFRKGYKTFRFNKEN